MAAKLRHINNNNKIVAKNNGAAASGEKCEKARKQCENSEMAKAQSVVKRQHSVKISVTKIGKLAKIIMKEM